MKNYKKKVNVDSRKTLFEALALLKNADEAQKFLEDLCTPAELEAMSDRWKVVYSIKEGKSYRQIYEETGVSVTTVGRVVRALMFGEGGYNLVFNRQQKKTSS